MAYSNLNLGPLSTTTMNYNDISNVPALLSWQAPCWTTQFWDELIDIYCVMHIQVPSPNGLIRQALSSLDKGSGVFLSLCVLLSL